MKSIFFTTVNARKFSFAVAVFMLFSFFSLPVSAKSKSKTKKTEPPPVEYDASAEAVNLKLPPRKGAFPSVSENVLAEVENGSPQSLKNALSVLKKDAASYEEDELILVNVACSLMNIVWPSETYIFDAPPVTEKNAYTGAIDSARQGVYDSSTGNTDFLTIVLPSVVLVTSEARSDYYAEAEEALKSALKLRKDSVLANYLLGLLYKRMQNYESAKTFLKKAHEGTENNLETGMALIQTMLSLGQNEAAYTGVKKLLESNPQNKALLKLTADTAYENGDLTGAEQYVARVLQQEPDNTKYILFRAKILVSKNEYIKAASLLDVYARTDTKARDYLVLRAKVQKDWNRNITAATKTLEEALSLYPDDREIILAAASLAGETGNTIAGKNASQLVDQILAEEGDNMTALQIQINEMVKNKKWNEAYKSSSSLLKLKNRPEDAVFTHIEICISSGRKDEAWKLASGLYSSNPSDENVLQAYISVLVATGRNGEAQRLINQLMSSGSGKLKSFLYYQKSFLDSGEDAILADLRSSLTANPRNRDALYRLYQIYYAKKEYRKAQYYLKQVVALSPADESLLAKNRELTNLVQGAK